MDRANQHELESLGILDIIEDGAFIFRPDSLRFIYVNEGAIQQTGYSKEELLGMTPLDLTLEFDESRFRQLVAPLVCGDARTTRFSTTHRLKGGDIRPVEVILQFLGLTDNGANLVAIVRDITERREAEETLREQKDFLNAILENEPECVKVISTDGRLLQMNRAGLAMLETRSLDDAQQEGLINYVHPEDRGAFIHLSRRVFKGNSGKLEFRIRGKKGTERWLETHASPLRNAEGNTYALVGVTRDITERKANEARIEFLAFHDSLTTLPNRVRAKDHFELAMAHAKRTTTYVAFLFLDLDNFKTINDSLGHAIGDTLLKSVATRLGDGIRATDTISRQGGDEFLLILPDMGEAVAVSDIAEKILYQLSLPFEINGYQLFTSASIGIAVYPDDGDNFDILLKKADTAMYQAKNDGRSTYRFYQEQMNIDAVEQHQMLSGLAKALERQEFVLQFQPQIDLSSRMVIGAEALIRWQHPERGLIAPESFIALAEDSGHIVPIGEWVLLEACKQAAAWRKAGFPKLVIAVNLSAVQFKRGNLEMSVTRALTESGLDPDDLELELTESILIQNTEQVLATVRKLKTIGVRLSIDDFGTGYSSLAYLSRFSVDKLKIDRSFVQNMVDDAGSAAIVRAIIQMAKSLNLKTIAEGVEDENTLARLRLYHCDAVQGYYYGRPMTATEFSTYLSENQVALSSNSAIWRDSRG
ncbi:sensor domain-containing protein [Thiobacillus sedimenti]|uniref:EAL domain-containing protein n=1 Tax=Thiobacillus sedimenti TaxID=3110231 RepID=A0ABZ1CIJ1_9PROT|nr:EAL domain-containing protein [Thiobacillus sp. SCUT-2]WRS39224.1 EAL domain-containing protein [Thiobacillus sp. SCUT-2]